MRRSYLRGFIRDRTFVTDGTWRFCSTQELLRLGSHCLRDAPACSGSGDVPPLRDSRLPNAQRRLVDSIASQDLSFEQVEYSKAIRLALSRYRAHARYRAN